nr:hypothetical protein Iba_chr12cCG19900 [Ipomoea batatas]
MEEALYEQSVRENPGLALSYRRASVRHALRPDAFLSSRIFIDTDIVIRKRHGTTVKKGADVAKQGVKRPGELPIGYQTPGFLRYG